MQFPYRKPMEPREALDPGLIIFYSSPDYAGNALAFYEYVQEHTDYRAVWALKDKNVYSKLKEKGLNCFWVCDKQVGNDWFSKAKYVVTTHEYDNAYPKYDGQVYVALSHSLTIGWDQFMNRGWEPDALAYGKWKSTMADIYTVSSELTRTFDAASFFYDARKAFVTGVPRCDLLYKEDGRANIDKIFPRISERYGKMLLYVPTARQSYGLSMGSVFHDNFFGFEKFDAGAFSNVLKAEVACIIVKFHPADEEYFRRNEVSLPDHCFLLSSEMLLDSELSLYHLLNGFDVLIGDFSSLTHEFLLLNRPIVRVFTNIDSYVEQWGAGFGNIDFWFPGDKVHTQSELETAIAKALHDPTHLEKERSRVRSMLFKYTDGNSCARVLEAMQNHRHIDNIEYEMYTTEPQTYISELQTYASELQTHVSELQTHVSEQQTNISELQTHVSEQQTQLFKSNSELNLIKSSRSFRLMARLRRMFWPEGSRRQFLLRFTAKAIRHPILMLRSLTPRKIKTFSQRLLLGVTESYTAIVAPLPLIDAKERQYDTIEIPQFGKPLVSIIIPACNEWEYTHACIEAIVAHSQGIPYEVIVADDASTDETQDMGKYISGAVHARNEQNLQFLRTCNRAARNAKSDYIVFLNNDTQVQPNWLEPLVRLMESDSSIGLVGSKLVYPSGHLQEAGGILWKDGSAWNYGRMDDPSKPDYNYVKDVDYISGAAIMVRRAVWNQLGGFDERFAPAYCEDSDLAFAIRQLGYRTVYQPQSVVVHFEGISHGTDVASGQKKYQEINQKKFFHKWESILTQEHFSNGKDVFWARDRSANKKTILFIDHYVPMYDKDAGSRHTFGYVKLCVEMGYRVLFLGDNFHAHQPYTDELQQLGVMVLYGGWYQKHWEQWVIDNARYLDIVYLNRPHVSEKYIDIMRSYTQARIIYHGIDLHCMRIRAQYETQKGTALLKEAEEWEKRERKLFMESDAILTVSEKEKPVIEAMAPGKRVETIPIYYFNEYPEVPQFEERRNLLFIGGFGHPPNTDGILWFVHEVFPLLPGDVKLWIVGSWPPEQVKALASNRIVVTGYLSDQELTELYLSSRIAIVPLRFGAGVKGKTIEAIYNSIPVVSTSFGVEGLPDIESIIVPRDGAIGFAQEIERFISSDCACMEAVLGYKAWLARWFSKMRAMEVVAGIMEN